MSTHLMRVSVATLAVLLVGTGCGASDTEQSDAADSTAKAAVAAPDKLTVYYFHTSYRCWTCNQFEKLTKEILGASFAEQVADGAIELQEVEDGMKQAHNMPIQCTGCGVCVSVCPSGALSLKYATRRQVSSAIEAIA